VRQIDRVAAIDKIRLTGGDPLCRPGLPALVAALRTALPTAKLALTTNGSRLAPLAAGGRRLPRTALRRLFCRMIARFGASEDEAALGSGAATADPNCLAGLAPPARHRLMRRVQGARAHLRGGTR